MKTRITITAALAGAVLLLAGCGASGDDDPEPSGGGEQSSEPAPTGTTSDAASDDSGDAAGPVVTTAESDLGTILVDGEGMTLYLFTNDTEGVSTCEGDCLANWPAVTGEAEVGEGVDAVLLGTLERSDGTTQASYNGWPLYYFVQDAAPGDTTGQGVNDVWFVVSPDGEMVGSAG